MSLSFHAASVPLFDRGLERLDALLDAAAAHAAARGFSPDAFLALRLAPDMLPFTKQVQIASDTAKGCTARLAGAEIVRFEDDETTLAALKQRVARTRAVMAALPAASFEGAAGRRIELPRRDREPLRLDAETYLKHHALPNFFFHLTTAYALLRGAGVPLGKLDFLGRFD